MKEFENVATVEGSAKWKNAIHRNEEMYLPTYGDNTMRTDFDRDYTRVINTRAYRRLKNKTQVFFAPKNDHICTRMEHVMLVESISHTISNYLGLNNELTKAIAIAHDIGHSPFGHQGEYAISEITQREFGEKFWHEKNGVHLVDNLELLPDYAGNLKNLNLTYAVRDGIISHCGEVTDKGLLTREEAIDLSEYKTVNQFNPYTWEGCVVKMSDTIAYIGRDIEDAEKMNLLSEKEIEKFNKIIEDVKLQNSNIINYFVVDLCNNSNIKDGLRFSDKAFETLKSIKEFNYKQIYKNAKISPSIRYFRLVINEIFYTLKNEFAGKNTIKNLKKMKRYYPNLSSEFIEWLSRYSNIEERDTNIYRNKLLYDLSNLEDYERAIVDYISGMTDQYIINVYNEIVSF
mgnify:FL=1